MNYLIPLKISFEYKKYEVNGNNLCVVVASCHGGKVIVSCDRIAKNPDIIREMCNILAQTTASPSHYYYQQTHYIVNGQLNGFCTVK